MSRLPAPPVSSILAEPVQNVTRASINSTRPKVASDTTAVSQAAGAYTNKAATNPIKAPESAQRHGATSAGWREEARGRNTVEFRLGLKA